MLAEWAFEDASLWIIANLECADAVRRPEKKLLNTAGPY